MLGARQGSTRRLLWGTKAAHPLPRRIMGVQCLWPTSKGPNNALLARGDERVQRLSCSKKAITLFWAERHRSVRMPRHSHILISKYFPTGRPVRFLRPAFGLVLHRRTCTRQGFRTEAPVPRGRMETTRTRFSKGSAPDSLVMYSVRVPGLGPACGVVWAQAATERPIALCW